MMLVAVGWDPSGKHQNLFKGGCTDLLGSPLSTQDSSFGAFTPPRPHPTHHPGHG